MLEIRTDRNRHVVCVFNRGVKITHYLGIENGPMLHTHQMETELFERVYAQVPKRIDYALYTPIEFATAYTRNATARAMVPLSPSAVRVLMAIMRGQPTDEVDDITLNQLENEMAKVEATEGFRKPDGPVAMVHKFLDTKIEGIKAGTISRKELIDKLVEKGYAAGTVVTQAGVWARNNGVSFTRPAAAAAMKKEVRAKVAKVAKEVKAKVAKVSTKKKMEADHAAAA